MINKENILFDEYQRYATISRLIEFHRKNDSKKVFKILELGSNEHKDLSLFLNDDKILFTDIKLTEKMQNDPDFMEVDGTSTPFDNDEFDFVISSDVLEHVPSEKRIAFISEAVRVSKIGAILCFPNNTEEVKNTELRVNAYYKAINGIDHYWLNEHIQNGLPDKNEIEAFLKGNNLDFYSFCIGSVEIWEKMWYCCFDSLMSDMWEYKSLIDNYYNKNIYPYDIGENCYRVFYVISKNKTDIWQNYSSSLFKKATNNVTDFLDTLIQAHFNSYTLTNLKTSYLGISSNIRWNNNPKVFPDYGNGYSESTKIVCTDFDFRYGVLNTKVGFPKAPLRIRFDPVDCLYCLVSEIKVMANNSELPISWHNGSDLNGVMLFDTIDSNIYYENSLGANEFYITAKISAFNDDSFLNALKTAQSQKINLENLQIHVAETYNQCVQAQSQLADVNGRLSETERNLFDSQNQVISTQEQLNAAQNQVISMQEQLNTSQNQTLTIVEQHIKLQNQFSSTENDLSEAKSRIAYLESKLYKISAEKEHACIESENLKKQYDAISNSTCWKITYPLRKFLDLVKSVFKKTNDKERKS